MKTLGPANDNDHNVQIEIRAAEMIAQIAEDGGGDSNIWEGDGSITISGGPWHEEYNKRLWPWDPSRPVAGQFEENERKDQRLIQAIKDIGADVTPPELTVEQLADDLCDGCDEPKTECRRTYAGCLYRPDSDDVHGPCCDLNCPDMATHFSRTGSIP